MSLTVKEVISQKDIREFVDFLYVHYKKNDYWVPPLRKDEMKTFDPENNPVFKICKTKMWLVYRANVCVGRICGIIIPAWNKKTGEKLARFTRIEFIDDREVSAKLFSIVEQWAREEKMDGIVGPLGFSNLDQSALLIEGHDWLPSIASNYQWDYYREHFEILGYQKEIDWLEFRINFPDELPEKSFKVAEMLKKRYGLKAVNFSSMMEILPFKEEIAHLYNESFSALYGTYPLPDTVLNFYFDKYIRNLNPRYVKVILNKDDKIVGFLIALPSLSKAMRKANGSLFPFGFIPVLRARKKKQ